MSSVSPKRHEGRPGAADAAVLLSTFNGERYLPEFLESLGRQSFRSWTLYWRDDGSTDATSSILRSHPSAGRLVELPAGQRLGPAQSFLQLLRAATLNAHESYHFADQDDVWLPDKIERAHSLVAGRSLPTLYHCRQRLINGSGAAIGMSRAAGPGSFENALVENVVVGCSSAFNSPAALLGAAGLPRQVLMHDWWMYLLVSCFGEIVYSREPCILYRQHGGNVVGAAKIGLRGLLTRILRHMQRPKGMRPIRGQLQDFLDIHGTALPESRRLVVERLARLDVGVLQRMSLAMDPKAARQSALGSLLLRVAVLSDRY